MSSSDKTPSEGTPSIESMLKSANWEARLAEARVKRELVLAAKRAEQEGHVEGAPPIGEPVPEVPPPPQSLTHQNPPVSIRQRILVGLAVLGGAAFCAAMGALVLWVILK